MEFLETWYLKANFVVSKIIYKYVCVSIPMQNYKVEVEVDFFLLSVLFICAAKEAWRMFHEFEFEKCTHAHIYRECVREKASSKSDWIPFFLCMLVGLHFNFRLKYLLDGILHRYRVKLIEIISRLFRLFFHTFLHLHFVHFNVGSG